MQTGLVMRCRRLESAAHGALVCTDPLEYVGEDRPRVAGWPPVRAALQQRAVGDVDRHVAGAVLPGAADVDAVAGDLGAQLRRLTQRQRDRATASHVSDMPGPLAGERELGCDQLD